MMEGNVDSRSDVTLVPDEVDDSTKLCLSCRRLDLRPEKFVIKDRTLASRSGTPQESTRLGTSPEPSELGSPRSPWGIKRAFTSVGEVRSRKATCRLCDLLCSAVERYSLNKEHDQTKLFLSWEIDGRKIISENQHVNQTRRVRVRWRGAKGHEQDAYLVFVAPAEFGRPASDAYTTSATDLHFLGRGPVEPREKQALIMSWINLCQKEHGRDCKKHHGSAGEFQALLNGTYFGVIDVVDMNLTELPTGARYVALSYVWGEKAGREAAYKTRRSNVMRHIQHGGLERVWDKLPRTIQDAILLVNRLGERYLWVDSLCIVQDSASSWELNAAAMHLVYGNAYFTICAADGDAQTGLVACEPIIRPFVPGASLLKASPLCVEVSMGVRLLVSRAQEAVIQDSSWNQRGWTFQERLLSRRCLIFADGQVYYQCRSSVVSEDVFSTGKLKGWSLDWMNSPARVLGQLERRSFWFYMEVVRLYTGRSLTMPKDVLTAFQGIAWLMEQRFRAPLLFGLPTSHFDLALLWEPAGVLQRRTVQSGTGFPSWSWCGWMGGKAEFRQTNLIGCLANVQEWLRSHTWIQWHIRDEQGDLIPLWNGNFLPEDRSKEHRWRGYAGQSRVARVSSVVIRDRKSVDNDSNYLTTSSSRRIRRQSVSHTAFRTGRTSSPPPSTAKSGYRMKRSSTADYLERLPTGYYTENHERVRSRQPDVESSPPPMRRSGVPAEPSPCPLLTAPESEEDSDDFVSAEESPRSDYSDEPSYAERSRPRRRAESKDESKDKGKTLSDPYGRTKSAREPGRFTSILPDNPFGVVCRPFDKDKRDISKAMPILQFWTWTAELYVSLDEEAAHETMSRCNILDAAGDWCGTTQLPQDWIADWQGTPLLFAAISDAHSFTDDECPDWNYYIPKTRKESEWDLYYVLLLQRNTERALWERVALGKVFQAAFAGAEWTEVKLG